VIQSIIYSIERNDHLKKIRKNETLLKKKNDQLEELIAQKDRLISIISHDVRGPIGTVYNFLKLLHNKYNRLEADDIQNHIQKCFNATQSTYHLIETLLEWAHTQSGRRQVVPKTVDCNELITLSIRPLLEIANKKDIRIVDLTPSSLTLYADIDMISTVIRNLVSNAIKFSHHDSLIKIEFAEDNNPDLAQLKVIDSGVGMNKENLTKVLDIGEGYSSPGTDNEKGTGFGLILCEELIEKNGGTLWIESKENEGTTINFTVPLKK
jgi:signal transduction histidine kinase